MSGTYFVHLRHFRGPRDLSNPSNFTNTDFVGTLAVVRNGDDIVVGYAFPSTTDVRTKRSGRIKAEARAKNMAQGCSIFTNPTKHQMYATICGALRTHFGNKDYPRYFLDREEIDEQVTNLVNSILNEPANA